MFSSCPAAFGPVIFMISSVRHAALAALFLLLLAGCGQKGPLYLPTEDPAKASEPDEG